MKRHQILSRLLLATCPWPLLVAMPCAALSSAGASGEAASDRAQTSAPSNGDSPLTHEEECPGVGGLGIGSKLGLNRCPGDAWWPQVCIPEQERAYVSEQIQRNRVMLQINEGGVAGSSPLTYPLFPMAGGLDEDRLHTNFVDLQPGSGILDFNCTLIAYNGHDGIDTAIHSWRAQLSGVPIFAALDGVVTYVSDGQPDQNECVCGAAIPGWPECPSGTLGNAVVIDHGGGHETYYWHMKSGSVSVVLGDVVAKGQQLGLVGSSGCSTGPHLHFESVLNGLRYEPFVGQCHDVPGGWTQQEPLHLGLRALGFATCRDSPQDAASSLSLPVSVQKALSDPRVYFWVKLANLPAASTWQVRFLRPSGTVAYTSPIGTFQGGQNPFLRTSWWWWWYTIADMQVIPGTWTVQLNINGAEVVRAVFEVVVELDPNLNRPPRPIAVSITPRAARMHDALLCTVDGDYPLADPDFDLVHHRYVWKVNGTTLRDVTTAARSDTLRRSLARTGDLVSCTVTPTDGRTDGQSSSASVTIVASCASDLDGSGVVDGADLTVLLAAWGTSAGGDTDGDGDTDGSDLTSVLSAWGTAGC